MTDKYIKTIEIEWKEIEPHVFEKACVKGVRGLKISILRIDSNKNIAMHEHADTRYNFILKGSMSDGNRKCEAGDIIINKKGSKHFLNAGPEGCEFILIWN